MDAAADIFVIRKSPFRIQRQRALLVPAERFPPTVIESASICDAEGRPLVRKLIAFDDDTSDKLKQLARDRIRDLLDKNVSPEVAAQLLQAVEANANATQPA